MISLRIEDDFRLRRCRLLWLRCLASSTAVEVEHRVMVILIAPLACDAGRALSSWVTCFETPFADSLVAANLASILWSKCLQNRAELRLVTLFVTKATGFRSVLLGPCGQECRSSRDLDRFFLGFILNHFLGCQIDSRNCISMSSSHLGGKPSFYVVDEMIRSLSPGHFSSSSLAFVLFIAELQVVVGVHPRWHLVLEDDLDENVSKVVLAGNSGDGVTHSLAVDDGVLHRVVPVSLLRL